MALQGLGKSGSHTLMVDPWEWAAAQRHQFAAPPQPKKKSRGGFLSSIISELGGAGGAVGGAAAGASLGSVVPGIGTLIGGLVGAGVGGFTGGTGGRLIENKVRDNEYRLGDALKEGAFTGALSAVPFGGAAKAVRTAAKGAAGKPIKAGVLQRTGQRLESRAGGYGQGTKLPDGSRLTASRVQQFKALDMKERIPARHPDEQGRVIEQRLNDATSQLDNAVTQGNRSLTSAERKTISANILKGVKSNRAIANDPNALREVNQLANSLKNIRSLKSAVKAKRDIQKEINFNRNSSAAVPGKEQANKIALKVLDNFINKSHPAIGEANKRVSGLIKRLDLSGAESATLKNQSINAGGGIVGRVLTGDAAQATKSRAGNLLQGGTPSSAGIASRGVLARELAKQTIGGGMVGGSPQADVLSQNVAPTAEPSQYPDTTFGDTGLGGDMTAPPQSLYGPEQLMADIQRDPKHLSDYIALAKYSDSLNKVDKPNANQQKTAMALQNARNVVGELTQAYAEVGGPQGAGTGTARNLAGKVRLDQNARNYNDLRQAFLSRIARAFGEVGTLNEGDIQRALGAIPDLADNQQTAARKLAILNSLLAQAEQNNSATYSSSSDLADVLSQLQGGYQ